MATLEDLKYPIGRFQKPRAITNQHITDWIATLKNFPEALQNLIEKATDETLVKTYRPDGWSILQLIHHCADSHMHAFIRFKLALTEESPKIKPYLEDRWSLLPDVVSVDPQVSLDLLKNLHTRWVVLLQSLHSKDLNREYIHPEHGKRFSLASATGMYAWHCQHHLEHIKMALKS